MSAVEKKVHILPSQRVADIKVHYMVDEEEVPIKNGSTVSGVAGELIQGISKSSLEDFLREEKNMWNEHPIGFL